MIKDLLLTQLTDIHATMVSVHERNQELDMRAWITKLADQSCGTVACICGWQSLGSLDNFPIAKYWAEVPHHLGGVAWRVSDDLDNSCFKVFGDSYLVEAIYDADMEGRREHAKASELFSEDDLNRSHLNKEEPTALEAANFVALCIKKVKTYEQ